MGKEWQGDIKEDLVLSRGLSRSGFLHYGTQWGEDAPHGLRFGDSNCDVGLFHGWS